VWLSKIGRAERKADDLAFIGQIDAVHESKSRPVVAQRGDVISMLKVKDTLRATVNLTFDGRVIKVYHGPNARARFDNEVRILRLLEARHCPFVPRLLEASPEQLRIVTTNCGGRVEHLDDPRRREIFDELETFGVRHDDPEMRNVTYRQADGRFCVIDFEFATILGDDNAAPPPPGPPADASAPPGGLRPNPSPPGS
jgi:hypothetical protein